ncbi:MAG: TetR family transcriptional regulator [Burkholderiaceae bacterium]|nr:TetR family transcriptional regulator [Burkholderiaceae bacterium]
MTRPQASDYDHKKQLILDKAAELFGVHGFETTTMHDVALACGASKSHVYHYFGRKEDLLFAIVSEHIRSLAAELAAIADLPLAADQRFARMVQAFVECASASRNQHLVLMHDLKFLPAEQRAEVSALQSQLLDMMVAVLRELNGALLSGSETSRPYALMVYGTMIWTFTWYRPDGPIKPAELAARMAEVFLDGLRAAQGPVINARAAEPANESGSAGCRPGSVRRPGP